MKGVKMKFNIDDTIKIKLTEAGRLDLRRRYKELEKRYASLGHFEMPEEDGEGWSKWSLMELILTFGPTTYQGLTMPFESEVELDILGKNVKIDEAALDKLRNAVIDAEYNYLKGLKEAFQNGNLGFDKYES